MKESASNGPLGGLQEPERRRGDVGGERRLAVLAQVQVGSGGAVGLGVGDRDAHGQDLAARELADQVALRLAHVGHERCDVDQTP